MFAEAGVTPPFVFPSFEAGYQWGHDAEVFLADVSEAVTGPINRAAASYSKGLAVSAMIGTDASFTAHLRGTAIATWFAEVVPLLDGKLIANGEATGFSSTDDGFDEWKGRQDTTGVEAAVVDTARGFFHCGVAFYAFETQLLLSLRRLQRA